MSDYADFYRDMKNHRQAQKAKPSNVKKKNDGIALVEKHADHVDYKNNNEHMICTFGITTCDYWPSSGRWQIRSKNPKTAQRGWDAKKLIEYLKVKLEEQLTT